MRKRSSLILSVILLSLGCAFGQYAPPSAPQQASLPASTSAPEPAIDCAGYADGLYVRDPHTCNDGFYKCANDRSFYYRCPSGLFFSIEDAQCEYRQLIPACGGQRPVEASSASAPVATVNVYQTTTQAPYRPPQTQQPVYQAPVYIQPTTTQAPYQPPQTQQPIRQAPVFVQPTQAPYQPPQPQPPTYQQPQAPVFVQPTTTQAPYQPPQSRPSTYQQQSVPSYQISYTQQPAQAPIAASIPVSQPAYQQQQYGSQAPAPIAPSQQPAYQQQYGNSAPSPAPIAASVPASQPAYQQQQQQYGNSAPSAPQLSVNTQAPVDFNCGGKQDGYYSKQACTQNTYYSCVGGIATQLTCAQGTVYDPSLQACDYPEECGKPKTTTAQPMVNYGRGWEPPTTTPASTLCVSRMDGFYARGHCVPDYLHCSNNIAFDLKCPSGLVFRNDSCTYLSDCLFPTTPAPQLAIQTSPAPPPLTWCRDNQRSTGFYSQGCSSKFYSCNGGFTTELSCPASLAYDQTIGQCEERQFVVACGGRPRPPTTTTIAAPVAPVRRPNFNCAGKQDGFYGQGCGGTYFVCIGSVATDSLQCPGQLVYDQAANACEERQFAVACGGRPRPPSTTPPAPLAPIKPVNFNCANLADGYYYTSGCVSTYYSCNGGNANEFQCQAGTKYSPKLHGCDYPSQVPECGGTLPTTTQSAPVAPVASMSGNQGGQYGYAPQTQAPVFVQPTTTQAPYQPPQTQAPVYQAPQTQPAPVFVQPTTQPPAYQPQYAAPSYQQQQAPSQPLTPVAVSQQQPGDSSDTNQCAHLQNGIYGRRCQRHYFVCTDHKIFEFTCPSGYAYDRTIARCGPLDKIQGCSMASPSAQQPGQAPASPTFFRTHK